MQFSEINQTSKVVSGDGGVSPILKGLKGVSPRLCPPNGQVKWLIKILDGSQQQPFQLMHHLLNNNSSVRLEYYRYLWYRIAILKTIISNRKSDKNQSF